MSKQASTSHLNEKLLRSEFEEIIQLKLKEINQLIYNALNSATLDSSKIDVVVMTGGSSLIPAVQQLVKSIFGEHKVKNFDVFESVAKGLALKAQEVYH